MRGARRALRIALVAAAIVGAAALLRDPVRLEVAKPAPGRVSGLRGVELIVRFPDPERVAPETLRILLNGADVTEQCTVAANGAYGRLFGLLDGENVLRLEIFARRWWLPGLLLEESREIPLLMRRPQDLNRA